MGESVNVVRVARRGSSAWASDDRATRPASRVGDQVRFFWQDWAFIGEDELPPDRAREFMESQRAAGDNELFLSCLREMTRQKRVSSDSSQSTSLDRSDTPGRSEMTGHRGLQPDILAFVVRE